MFSKLQNAAKLEISLRPQGPFLIKARESLDPTRPDMEFVRLNSAYGESLYVPGSSLKGVTRSNVEALVRAASGREDAACNSSEKACGTSRCDTCAMFGSMSMASHIHFGDLLPWHINDSPDDRANAVTAMQAFLSSRTNVAINRKTGGAKSGALFEMEVLSGGAFFGEVVLENYELWQLGLLLLVFGRIDDGTIRMGSGTSRGLGRLKLNVDAIHIEQFGSLAVSPVEITGVDGARITLPDANASDFSPLGNRWKLQREALDDGLRHFLRLKFRPEDAH